MAIAVTSAQALGVRAIAICAVLAGCGPEVTSAARGPGEAAADPGARDTAVAPRGAAVAPGGAAVTPGGAAVAPAGAALAAPGLRLPDGVTPVSYDLTLELDPARDSFAGHVAIAITVADPGATRLWLHAVELDITRAQLADHGHLDDVALVDRASGGASGAASGGASGPASSQLRGFALPHPVTGTITLVIEYTGRVSDLTRPAGKDEEGLFRERAAGRWYLYSQAESIFARKIVPCFDEPRWKPAWRVTVLAPRDQVVLANAPMLAERALPDGRREVRFAEIALPSYLLAVAVGPFDVVDAGKLGRGATPVRLAVLAGDGKRVALARRELPRIIDALESYLGAPLPLAKLDLVAVPRFFGAMENVGLITFESSVLVGGRDLVMVTAHELAHQWFGNSVTPAWWDELWLSEAFATWLGDRITASLGAAPPPVLAHRARAEALAADDRSDARPLVHPIATSDDIEPAFDAIAYQKGGAVLATFERFAGSPAFQAALRAYLAAHAGTSVTSQALLDALAAATSPETAAALASNLSHAGTPVVELAVRCGAPPGPAAAMPAGAGPAGAILAAARDGVTIPVCVRFPASPTAATETSRACFLAGAHTEYSVPAAAGCPAWVVGNDGGRGYYRTVWSGPAQAAPLARLTPDERLARGDDAALAVGRGDLTLAEALGELTALAMTRDPYGELAALSVARAIDPIVPDPARPAWTAWLARRFADRLTVTALSAPSSLVDHVVRHQVVELAAGAIDPATLAAVRAASARQTSRSGEPSLRIAAARDVGALFAGVVDAAATAASQDARGDLLEDLGAFPASYAPPIVDLLLEPRFAAAQVWPALAQMLARGDTRTAAWRAIHQRFAKIIAALGDARARDVVAAAGALCDATARAELAVDVGPRLAAIGDGQRVLARALAAIDRCIARRAAAGDVAGVLASSPAPRPGAGL